MNRSNGDIWEAKVAMTGGGSCQWALSAVTLGIEYIDATHLGKDLVASTAVGVSLAFDNDASRNGQYTATFGDLNLSPKYYPYIIEWKLIRNRNDLTLLGRHDFILSQVTNVNNIKFEPLLDESKIVRYIEPEKKIKGVHAKIIYPDGSVISDGTVFPDFDTVDKMNVN